MGPRGRRERAGEQSEIFDIFEREREREREILHQKTLRTLRVFMDRELY